MAGHTWSSHNSPRFLSTTRLLATTFVVGTAAYITYRKQNTSRDSVPLPPLRVASNSELDTHEDCPILPGARDVVSPWGTVRVYEWGPTGGDRVLMIHGISTPSVGLRDLANSLVDRGCRVMLFDLWGHGHSGTPPLSMPHDMRLFSAQILLALTSSPISWTGMDTSGTPIRFSIVAYSMGAGIAVSFATDQPTLVHRLVLIAPGSLLRAMPWTYANPLALAARNGPAWLTRWWMRAILGAGIPVETATAGSRQSDDAAAIDEAKLWHWQLTHNPGFVHSFVSALDHAPIQDQQSIYRKLRSQLVSRQRQAPNDHHVLIILGGRDPYTLCDETMTDALGVLSSEHVSFVVFEGEGHEFPKTRGRETANVIWSFWNDEEISGQ